MYKQLKKVNKLELELVEDEIGKMITLNIFGITRGPYPFLMVEQQPVWTTLLWLVLILAINFGIAELLGRANRSVQQHN
jgi:hypothetical protein